MKIHGFSTGQIQVKPSFMTGSLARANPLTFLAKLHTEPVHLPAIPILVWLIETATDLILVDTGEHGPSRSGGLMATKITIEPDQELGPQLARLGFSVKDLTAAVLSHLHGDHVGGLAYLRDRPVLVARSEWMAFQTFPGSLSRSASAPVPKGFKPQLFDFAPEPYGLFDHSYPLDQAGLVRAVPTPGHSPGHLSVFVELDDVCVCLAGDASYSDSDLLNRTYCGYVAKPKTHVQTVERLRAQVLSRPTIYLPSHDHNSLARLQNRLVITA